MTAGPHRILLPFCFLGTAAVFGPGMMAGLGAAALLAQQPTATTEASPGLVTTRFSTLEGQVVVHLPDDVRAGDTISGTVFTEPAGRTPEERSRNAGVLEGLVVDVGAGEETSRAEDGVLRIVVPAAATTGKITIRGARDASIADAPFRVHPKITDFDPPPREAEPAADETAASEPNEHQDFGFSAIGQAGAPVGVSGPFDGEIRNTILEVAGHLAVPLAESPRGFVVVSPPDFVGVGELTVTEDGQVVARGEYRSLRIDLSAPKLSLQRGERTQLKVEVSGLDGIEEPVRLRLANHSPQVVQLEGGETQSVEIQPSQVGSDGRAVVTRTLTGQSPGGFRIQVSSPAYAEGAPDTNLAPSTNAAPN